VVKMLEELTLKNGTLSPVFDPLNTKYTVMMNNSQDIILDFTYKISNDATITIRGNNLTQDDNKIIITVANDFEAMNYELLVYKPIDPVVNTDINFVALNTTKKEISSYVLPCISSSCFIIILITFVLLFSKSKKRQ